ncbi:MAG: hypothetical protein HQL84_08105 [Magnetococcales bacterium]|nr:hypothetical protein [Magnetococcales bacterium]MBF0149993.1 hypothetical protein [Magnetococcales bacterium]MBF0174252.1 hypothetical protein [Magnetococcales bacterium]MBF0347780.1 hypothetical protein [Magnetococcales bacterium]MBF0631279.1 hypothetical protein [Magnetococcales bacterium]
MTCNPEKMTEFFAAMQRRIACPACFGNGWIVIPQNIPPSPPSEPLLRSDCPRCQGAGSIPVIPE